MRLSPKLLIPAAVLLCVAALVLVAAPAFSVSRWRPEPVDFELTGPSAAVSPVLRPGKRFNLVGLRWRGRTTPELLLRTRRSGGAWTPWTHVPPEARGMSAPVWVGEADEVQYRLARRVRDLRLHFVNVRGTATRADRARTVLRRVANSAAVSVAGLFRTGAARAAESQPPILPRASWGAEDCPPRGAPQYGRVKAAVIHHTVNANDYTAEEAPAVVLAICRFHRNSNGWNDIGYNFLVDRFGRIYEGRAGGIDQPVAGAQVSGFNFETTGIANIGDFRGVPQTPQALEAMAKLIRWKLPRSGVPTAGRVTLTSSSGSSVAVERISGHRDLNSTSCPGDGLYGQLPELRARVGRLPPLPPGPGLRAFLARQTVRYKGAAAVSGTLVGSNGLGLEGRTVLIEVRRKDGTWRVVATAVTGGDGGFTATVRPRGNRTLRARFAGDASLPPSTSAPLSLSVRPRLRLIGVPETGTVGAKVTFRVRVAPRKGRVTQVLQLRRRGSWRTVGRKRLRARRGRLRGSFVPAVRGHFRVYVVAQRDGKTVKGRSPLYRLVVG